jgi:hypothetical protein
MAGQTTKGIGKLTYFGHTVQKEWLKFRRRGAQKRCQEPIVRSTFRAIWLLVPDTIPVPGQSTRRDDLNAGHTARMRRVGPELRLSQFCPWRSTCVRDLNAGWFASQTRRVAYSGEFSNFFAESACRLRIELSTSAKTAGELQNPALCVVRAIAMQPHRSCTRDMKISDSINGFHSCRSEVVCCSN